MKEKKRITVLRVKHQQSYKSDGSYGRSKLNIENYLAKIDQKKLKSTSCRFFRFTEKIQKQ